MLSAWYDEEEIILKGLNIEKGAGYFKKKMCRECQCHGEGAKTSNGEEQMCTKRQRWQPHIYILHAVFFFFFFFFLLQYFLFQKWPTIDYNPSKRKAEKNLTTNIRKLSAEPRPLNNTIWNLTHEL